MIKTAHLENFVAAIEADYRLASVVAITRNPRSVVFTTRDSHAAHAIAIRAGRKALYHRQQELAEGSYRVTVQG